MALMKRRMREVSCELAMFLAGTSILATTPKANAQNISYQTSIYTQADINPDGNPFGSDYRSVYLNCPIITINGRTPQHDLVGIFIEDQQPGLMAATSPVGGLTLLANHSSTTNGWLWACSPSWGNRGVNPGEIPVTGLNGSSIWIVLLDNNGNHNLGTYTEYDDGSWSITPDPGDGPIIGASNVQMTGVDAFPSSGTGPVTIQSINITAFEAVLDPPTVSSIVVSVYNNPTLASLTFASLLSNMTYSVECSAELVSWSPLFSFTATGAVHSITVTNGSDRGFYRLAK